MLVAIIIDFLPVVGRVSIRDTWVFGRGGRDRVVKECHFGPYTAGIQREPEEEEWGAE